MNSMCSATWNTSDCASFVRSITWYYICEESNIPIDYSNTLHPTRCAALRLISFRHSHTRRGSRSLNLLGDGELSAGELIEKLGMEQANISQHLTVLRSKQLVVNRKAGNQVFYSVRDPIINKVLALMRRYFQKHLKEALELLDEMDNSSVEAGR